MSHANVDILMAVYNGERFLEAQLDSILNQSYPHFHLIIRDDGSKDNSRKIIEEKRAQHPEKITLLPPQTKNGGVVQNFSALMLHSKAPYIMFSDQDDIWLPNKIRLTLNEMERMEKLYSASIPLLVHTDLKVVDHELGELAPSFYRYSQINPEKVNSLYRLLGQNVVTGCTMMINRLLLEKSWPIPKETLMHDWWVALVAMAFGKIAAIYQPTICYRQHHFNQVGAKNGHFFSLIRKIWSNRAGVIQDSQKTLARQHRQAVKFLERYGNEMSTEQKKMIDGFCLWSKGSYWERLCLLYKFGTVKSGFIKIMGSIFLLFLRRR